MTPGLRDRHLNHLASATFNLQNFLNGLAHLPFLDLFIIIVIFRDIKIRIVYSLVRLHGCAFRPDSVLLQRLITFGSSSVRVNLWICPLYNSWNCQFFSYRGGYKNKNFTFIPSVTAGPDYMDVEADLGNILVASDHFCF